MRELLTFMMRLHGSSIWDEIVPDTGKQVAVVSATINNPAVKTDTVRKNHSLRCKMHFLPHL